jgi:c-di-GMP-binding flagellar brake protein YcgR
MQASDRRGAPRFRISIPLHFQMAKSSEPECHAETLDISSCGVLMETEAPPGLGAILVLRLRLPEMIMGWRVPEWSITGRVVHVETGAEPGKYTVGVQFHYYEAAGSQRGRLMAEGKAIAIPLVVPS